MEKVTEVMAQPHSFRNRNVEHLEEPTVRVLVPPDIFAVLDATPEIARAWRATTRRAFEWYLARGWSVTGFRRDDTSGHPAYILMNSSRAHT